MSESILDNSNMPITEGAPRLPGITPPSSFGGFGVAFCHALFYQVLLCYSMFFIVLRPVKQLI
jgi:hypothetical protein